VSEWGLLLVNRVMACIIPTSVNIVKISSVCVAALPSVLLLVRYEVELIAGAETDVLPVVRVR
jgi:hypothetical protein